MKESFQFDPFKPSKDIQNIKKKSRAHGTSEVSHLCPPILAYILFLIGRRTQSQAENAGQNGRKQVGGAPMWEESHLYPPVPPTSNQKQRI